MGYGFAEENDNEAFGDLTVRELAQRAKRAARLLPKLKRGDKDRALTAIAARLRASVPEIERANRADLESAQGAGMSGAMLDRLRLDPERIEGMARALEFVVSLNDPVGSRSAMQRLANGLLIGKQRLPLGLIAIIYESRPNVTVDAAALCFKAGNAVLLRGGKEARESNRALGELMRAALSECGLPEDAIVILPPGDREETRALLQESELIDLCIPRGGEGLIRFVAENARVPVIKHYKGVCHLFLDQGCDHAMAERLTLNSKVQRPGVCNALECLLVHGEEAPALLPRVAAALLEQGVELRGCPRTCQLVSEARPAADDDWGAEFLDKILAVRVVDGFEAAVEHIERYGSNHSEAICTNDYTRAQRWVDEVDASCVLVNASTRFNDGGQLGLGAEIGISTSKLHAYGPMGLESLTGEKWVVIGGGQTR